jgi:hypothetical protein
MLESVIAILFFWVLWTGGKWPHYSFVGGK